MSHLKFRKIVIAALAIVTLVATPLATAYASAPDAPAAQNGTVTDYDQLPVKGQLIVPAGKGFVAPDAWNGLNVTVWYGTADDTNTTMANLGNGIANDRATKYGGQASDYPTVIWNGPSVNVGGQCRGQFYSDATVLTAGVVYGDECPLLIEYNAEGHYIAQPATPPPAYPTPGPEATPQATEAPPTGPDGGFNWWWCLWPLGILALGLFTYAAIQWWRNRQTAPVVRRPPAPPAAPPRP